MACFPLLFVMYKQLDCIVDLSFKLLIQVNIFLCFAVFGLLVHRQPLYNAFGFFDSRPIYIGLIIIFQVFEEA